MNSGCAISPWRWATHRAAPPSSKRCDHARTTPPRWCANTWRGRCSDRTLGRLFRNRVLGVAHAVLRVDVNQGRLEVRGFGFAQLRIGADDDDVARGCAVRGGAVDRDDAGTLVRTDRVGDEALAVVDVVDVDLLVLADAGGVEQKAVDRARTLVMQFGMGDAGAVDLGFEQAQMHDGLAINRVSFTQHCRLVLRRRTNYPRSLRNRQGLPRIHAGSGRKKTPAYAARVELSE